MFVSNPALAQSGYQTINGTQVFTEIDQAAGVATFSNSCGSQSLTQGQLQNGAIPTDIIPCPRPRYAPAAPAPAPHPVQRQENMTGASGPPPKQTKPKMAVNAAACRELNQNANICANRSKAAASGQAAAFNQCTELYCRKMAETGCAPSSICTYGTSSNQAPVRCRVGQHLFFPGYGQPAYCQDNANGSGNPAPPDQSTITGKTQ